MDRVFVSYARPDEHWAVWLATIAKQLGFIVDLDIWNWRVGDDFTEKMNNALDEADIILLVMSKEYLDRGRYSSLEASAALALIVEAQKRPVVVVVEDVKLPALLRSRLVIRLHDLPAEQASVRFIDAMTPLLANRDNAILDGGLNAIRSMPGPAELLTSIQPVAGRLASVESSIATVADEAADRIRSITITDSEPLFVEQLYHEALRLGRTYLNQNPETVFGQAVKLREKIDGELDRTRKPDQLRDLHLSMSYAFGIMSYTALDLGHGISAEKLARASLAYATRSGDIYSRAWSLGTLSLIARFNGDDALSAQYSEKGLELPVAGTARCRLLSNAAESYAHLGDEQSMKKNLKLSLEALDQEVPAYAPTIANGIFYFPRARVHYYAASSLVQLPGITANEDAAKQAELAIELFETSGPLVWSYNDILVAKVHHARALMKSGHLDQVLGALDSVLSAPMRYRTSWHLLFLTRFEFEMATKRISSSRDGKDLSAAIKEYIAETSHLASRE